MPMSGISMYYNYYNVEGRYTPKEPEIAGWRMLYETTDDQIKSQNYNQEDEVYQAHLKLEEAYYSLGVSNRAKYNTPQEVEAALTQKYFYSGAYNQYTEEQKYAMYQNEYEMTLYGQISCGFVNDPHLTGDVKVATESEQKEYNRQAINIQLGNILKGIGLDSSLLEKINMIFTIDPFDYTLKVSGVDNVELTSMIEEALNKDNNARELFYHIIKNDSGSISDDVKLKYRVMTDFKNITGQDIRTYIQSESGLINENGESALEVYLKALETTDEVPALYKGDAYNTFAENLKKLLSKDYVSIPDMYLSIGYCNGELYDVAKEDIMISRFDVTA